MRKRLSFIGAVFALALMPWQSLAGISVPAREIASRIPSGGGQWSNGEVRDTAQAKDCATLYKQLREERAGESLEKQKAHDGGPAKSGSAS